MTITFQPALPASQVALYRVSCEQDGVLGTGLPVEEAYPLAELHGLTCPRSLCQEYGADVDDDGDVPMVNLHNANAMRVLVALGYQQERGAEVVEERPEVEPSLVEVLHNAPDLYGSDGPEAFIGRVLLALALSPTDAGVEAYSSPSGRWHEGPRREGHLQHVLAQLHDLAQWCAEHNHEVMWG